MAEPDMPTPDGVSETRTERLGMAVTPSEKEALGKIAALWPEKYDGISSVLRDYTPSQAVDFVRRLTSTLSPA